MLKSKEPIRENKKLLLYQLLMIHEILYLFIQDE